MSVAELTANINNENKKVALAVSSATLIFSRWSYSELCSVILFSSLFAMVLYELK